MRNWWVMPIVAVVASGCSKPAEKPEATRPAMVYVVSQAAHGGQAVYAGEIHAQHEADLGFRVGGKVLARLVELGAAVKPGQALARLDASDALLASTQAQAQLAGAEADAANAASELARSQKLVAQQFISPSALDSRITASKAAQARLNALRAQAGVTVNQSRYTTLTAEAAGVVTAVNVEAGQVVSAGQPVLRVAYDGVREVQVRVGESIAGQLKVGQPAQVHLWAMPDKWLPARVREIAPAADETRTYLVKVSLAEAAPAIRLGMSASVVLADAGVQSAAVALPAGALFQQGKQTAVWVVNQQHQVHLVPVSVVQYREDGMLVQANLPAGTQVIAAGAHKLHEGQAIVPAAYDGVAPAGSI